MNEIQVSVQGVNTLCISLVSTMDYGHKYEETLFSLIVIWIAGFRCCFKGGAALLFANVMTVP